MPNPTSIRTARRRRIFLRVLRQTAIVAEACRAAGAASGSFYNWRHADPDFADAWDRALADGITTLEDEAIRRARDGVEAPVFYQGKQVATARKYSDRLLVFLLKAHKPERYRAPPWWRRGDDPPEEEPPEARLTDEERDARIRELLKQTGYLKPDHGPDDPLEGAAVIPPPWHPPPSAVWGT